jgi:hypothetical protein
VDPSVDSRLARSFTNGIRQALSRVSAAEVVVRSDRRRRSEESPVEVLLQIPFRSEIMELPLVLLTVIFCLGAMVLLGRWWER